jgi:hypothetical protein
VFTFFTFVFLYVCSGLVTGRYPVKECYQMSSDKILKPEKRRDFVLLSLVPEKRRNMKSTQENVKSTT